MENLYLILVIVLFALAISDLVVGVSNDAVNFLNSAIGARVASFRTIMIVAALGVLVGATFSSGMMEVARKGIFHPDAFFFSEIIIIFLAVMITDVILLDLFNTFGFPTSTTVSIVFELLGSAVAVAIFKVAANAEQTIADLGLYINSDKALAIISGILLSVVIAFMVGALIQYLSRLVFSFNYKKPLKYFGSVFGGLAIASITYFIVIKGAKGSSLISEDKVSWIMANTWMLMVASLLGWTILLQLLHSLFRVEILKIVVLVGTFALAMAFAGNDLVNFIGVPLAGYESYKAYLASGAGDPDSLLMAMLKEPIKTNPWFLLAAGLVMVATLWTSRKARSVVETTIDLSRQDEGMERFQSSPASRFLVRAALSLSASIQTLFPARTRRFIDRQFHRPEEIMVYEHRNRMSFDMIRASVNLVVASILIAFGTSLKLPLSTTYVTFMVAMGTSLADRAWGRESAVYRITGVISVIGGWFLTAIIAFTASFLVATLIYWGGTLAIALLIFAAVFIVLRTHIIHRRRAQEAEEDRLNYEYFELKGLNDLIDNTVEKVTAILSQNARMVHRTIHALANEDLRELREVRKEVHSLNRRSKKMKDNVNKTIIQFKDDFLEAGPFYVQVVDYLREIAHCATYIAEPAYKHIDNNHKGLTKAQEDELDMVGRLVFQITDAMNLAMQEKRFDQLEDIILQQTHILAEIAALRKKQVKRIKDEKASSKSSLLYLDLLAEVKNLLLYSLNLMKSMRDLVNCARD
jgi:phosphate/sulfate permease